MELTKWAYLVVPLTGPIPTQNLVLVEKGREGWELITIEHSTAYFKKPCE